MVEAKSVYVSTVEGKRPISNYVLLRKITKPFLTDASSRLRVENDVKMKIKHYW